MSLEIYPKDFSTRYEISHAINITEAVYFQRTGTVQITVDASDYNIMALKTGNMIYDTDRDFTFLIVGIKADTINNYIIVNGKTMDCLLNRRVVAEAKSITTIETGVYSLINSNLRGLTRIQTAPVKGYTDKKDKDDEGNNYKAEGGQLLDIIQEIIEDSTIGYRMVWDSDALTHTFELYKGADKSIGTNALPFSEEQGTAKDLVLNEDDYITKNVAYVSGAYKSDAGNDTNYFTVEYGSKTGDERREIWIDSPVVQDEKESKSAARARAKAFGKKELAAYHRRRTFQISISPDELGNVYSIGDTIACSSARFGVEFTAQITGIKYTLGATGENTQVILGDPVMTVLGALTK